MKLYRLEYIRQRQGRRGKYGQRHVVCDLAKFVARGLVAHKPRSRYYRVDPNAMQTLVAYLVIREHVLKPVLAGVCHPRRGPPPKRISPIDQHYITLREELDATLAALGLVA